MSVTKPSARRISGEESSALGRVIHSSDARYVALIVGLCVAALVVLFCGDHLFTAAFEVGR